jgi:hypothetical protein
MSITLLNKVLRTFVFMCCMICLHEQELYSQSNPYRDFMLSANGHYGFILSHRHDMAHLIKGHITGGELNYVFRTDGSKSWQQLYKYPDLGICIAHMDLANPEQLGTMEAIYPYTNIRLNRLNKKVNANLRLGTGLCFITKPFDRITNHKNNVIGSHINGFVNIRFSWSYMITEKWMVNAGAGLTHASNGAIKTPNLGINIATLNLGVGYAFGNSCLNYKKDSIPPCSRTWKISVIGVSGVKELETPGGRKYMAYGLQGIAYKTLNYKNKLGGGIEFTYNNSTKKEWLNDSIPNPTFGDILQVGAKFSYAYTFSRLSLPVEFGVYVYKKQHINGMFFHRIGFRYMLTKHWIANVTLLTHFAKADYFEGGIGYEF